MAAEVVVIGNAFSISLALLPAADIVDAAKSAVYSDCTTVSAQYAAEHLDDLLSALDNGDSIEITRPNKPAVVLQRQSEPIEPSQSGKRILGAGRGLLRIPSDEEWDQMDREWHASFMHKFEGAEEA